MPQSFFFPFFFDPFLSRQEEVDYGRTASHRRKYRCLQDLLLLGQQNYRFCGVSVQRDFYLTAHGISHSTLDAAAHEYAQLSNGKRASRPVAHIGHDPDRHDAAVAWLRVDWLRRVAMVNARDDSVHVCFNPVAVWIWKQCQDEIGPLGFSTFLRAFNKVMQNISTPRTHSDLKNCSRCHFLTVERMRAATKSNWDQVERLEDEMQDHLTVQYEEKSVYWRLREQIWRGELSDILLVSMDGTRPLSFPSFQHRTSLSDSLPLLRFQLMSIIVHNERSSNSGRIGFYMGQGHEDSNVGVSYLDQLLKLDGLQHQKQLRLQLDGGSAAKSWPTVAYLGHLLELDRFDEIIVHFSIAEHGGDMNDGLTSHLRTGVRSFDCFSPQMMLNCWSLFYPTNLRPIPMFFGDLQLKDGAGEPAGQKGLMYDWKTLLDPVRFRVTGFAQQNVEKTEDSIHVWRFRRNNNGRAVLQVKRLITEADGLYSEPVQVLDGRVSSKPNRMWFHETNRYVGQLFEKPSTVCKEVIDRVGPSMTDTDRQWWRNFENFISQCELPTEYGRKTGETSTKTRAKVLVDRSKPPSLIRRGRRRETGRTELDEMIVDDEDPEDDDFDGEDPEYHVDVITAKEDRSDGLYYRVVWAKPYNDITWEPLVHLEHCQDKIDEFERSQEGLSHHNRAHAELQHEIRQHEAEVAERNFVECPRCTRRFKTRGLKLHQKHCKVGQDK